MTEPTQPPPTPARTPHHRLSASGHLGPLHLVFEAAFSAPWTVLFGPSGCGKSTILRALCGLTPDLHVVCQRFHPDGPPEVLQDVHVCVAPEHRSLAYAPQHAALFPHLTVEQNVSFAASLRAKDPRNSRLVHQAMDLFALGPLAHRLPRNLSGGERQRVSLARALAVPDAALVLLDEPFAGLDRALRDDLLPRLKSSLAERRVPVLSVTHDVDEALLLNAEVIRLEDGKAADQGPAPSVLAGEIQRLLDALHSKRL